MDDQHALELLTRERARIESLLGGLAERDDDPTDPREPGDAGEKMYDQELDEAQAEQLRVELDAIARAEQRVAEGTYGVSIESGEPIPDARLEAIPWAERTATEQARFDAGS
jgi:RNA polymerase-binding transcription factor